MMSVIHRLAGKLFHRAGHCAGDADGGEDGHERPREELEACRWCEFSPWSRAGGLGKPAASQPADTGRGPSFEKGFYLRVIVMAVSASALLF